MHAQTGKKGSPNTYERVYCVQRTHSLAPSEHTSREANESDAKSAMLSHPTTSMLQSVPVCVCVCVRISCLLFVRADNSRRMQPSPCRLCQWHERIPTIIIRPKWKRERMRQRNARQPSHSIMLDERKTTKRIFFGIVRTHTHTHTLALAPEHKHRPKLKHTPARHPTHSQTHTLTLTLTRTRHFRRACTFRMLFYCCSTTLCTQRDASGCSHRSNVFWAQTR